MFSRSVVVFLLLLTFHLSFGQTQYGSIRAHVVDSQTSEALPFVSVYLSQTTIGGYTNEQGDVEITKIPFGTHRLVISEVGHDTYQRSLIVQSGEPQVMTIKLLPKLLEEVKVRAKKDKQWNRQLERFERMFFGAERYKYCKITNPWVLDFKIVNGDFIAEASEPIKIENDFLGYKLEFTIRQCFFSATSFAITGITRFEENKGDDLAVGKWKENRENTYRGSPQHFFRAAVNNNVKSEGYEIYRDISKKEKVTRGSTLASNINFTIAPDSLSGKVKKANNGLYSISVPLRLEVHYLRKRAINTAYTDMGHPISWIEVKKGNLVVNKDGVVQNTESLTLIGSMSDMRVGDWLPLNYQPSQTFTNVPVTAPLVIKKDLREKPYIQTDRNYYYVDERIWFKGYMNYSMPLMRDSLSRTVHVELIDLYGPVVKKRYPIENGIFYGDILLERRLIPGLYQIKVYTSWMLNFDKELIFTKTIQLLDNREGVRTVSDYHTTADTTFISIHSDKVSYSPKEKITLVIDVKDSSDFRTLANFSIAITDLDLAVPVKSEKIILTNFNLDKKPSVTDIKVKTPIEYGIDFEGRLLVAGKPAKGNITFFQRNSAETFDAATDAAGKFKKNLAFYDTLEVYAKALSSNNRKGEVVMDTFKLDVPRLPTDPLKLDVYSSNNIKRSIAPELPDRTLLKSVEVTARKIEPATSTTPPGNALYGKADYTVDGNWMRDRNYIDVFQALSGRVPGLNYDQAQMTVRFGSSQYSTFSGGNGGGSPLILVDGVTMTEAQVISSVPIKAIDRVDVLKYSSTASFGNRGGNGVIVIYTRSGIPQNIEKEAFDKKKYQTIKWFGYNEPSKFSQSQNSATIFWMPSVTTDGKEPATITFDALDAVAKYRVVVEGITVTGIPVRAEKIIEIVKGH
jgi:hypothetical protein